MIILTYFNNNSCYISSIPFQTNDNLCYPTNNPLAPVIIPTYYNISNTISHYHCNLEFSSEDLLISKKK